MTKRHLQRWIGALGLGACLVCASQIARADGAPPVGAVGPAASARQPNRPLPDAGAPVDGHFGKPSYAEREAQQPQVADFEGGESYGIYIGGSAVAVVLFVVLLVVLL
jgi:hypothetical protein